MSSSEQMCAPDLLEPGVQIRPQMTQDDVLNFARLYGLKNISVTQLNAFDDKNFHIQVEEDDKQVAHEHGYVLKVTNSLDSKKLHFIEGQNELMIYLGGHGIRCPQPVKNLSGLYYSVEKLYHTNDEGVRSYGEHVVRLLTFQPGKILFKVPCTNELFYQAGKYIANLDQVLKGFHHPAYDNRKSLWTLDSVPELRKFMFAIKDNEQRLQLATRALEDFETEVVPLIPVLERGVLHGDFNEQNILVEEDQEKKTWNITGILDFGDTHISCYVFELAIAMCYMMFMCKDGDGLDAGGHVLAGYSTVRDVTQQEFHLLKTCVRGRLCQSVVLGAYSHLQDPGNDYIITTQEVGWRLLSCLDITPQDELEKRWRRIMASYQ